MAIRKVFTKAEGKVTKGLRISEDMVTMLTELAERQGHALGTFMALVLDDYLQKAVERGEIEAPIETKSQVG